MKENENYERLIADLVERGKLIEAGWMALREFTFPPDTPPRQLDEMRIAFMTGAQHLFTSIMGVLDSGPEPTENDMRRMALISEELDAFGQEIEAALVRATSPQKERLGDRPIEEDHRAMMNDLAEDLDGLFNGEAKGNERKTGFVLLVFPFGDKEGRCNFISNGADRKDIVVLFKEMIQRFQGGSEASGSA